MKNPSLELLSSIFNREVFASKFDKENKTISINTGLEINIYEFSEKCRQWAKEQSYILMIFGSVVYIVPDNFDADYFKFFNYKSCSEKTINESIFAACEWILTKEK